MLDNEIIIRCGDVNKTMTLCYCYIKILLSVVWQLLLIKNQVWQTATRNVHNTLSSDIKTS